MGERVDISGLDKVEVLFALYNNSGYQGASFLGAVASYTVSDAREDFEKSSTKYFDYLHGHVIKVDLSGDDFDPWGYDRDNGQGAAQSVIDNVRAAYKETCKIPESDIEERIAAGEWSTDTDKYMTDEQRNAAWEREQAERDARDDMGD